MSTDKKDIRIVITEQLSTSEVALETLAKQLAEIDKMMSDLQNKKQQCLQELLRLDGEIRAIRRIKEGL